MIECLEELLDDFPGPANQTRCFLHVVNLVVKSILKQFDLPKPKPKKPKPSKDDGDQNDGSGDDKGSGDEDDGNDGSGDEDDRNVELLKLAGDVDDEGNMMADNEDEDDNVEDWIDERDEMTEQELRRLSASVTPVRLLLTKVR